MNAVYLSAVHQGLPSAMRLPPSPCRLVLLSNRSVLHQSAATGPVFSLRAHRTTVDAYRQEAAVQQQRASEMERELDPLRERLAKLERDVEFANDELKLVTWAACIIMLL